MRINKKKLSVVEVAYAKAVKFDSFYAAEQAIEIANNLLTFDTEVQEFFDQDSIEELESYILHIRGSEQGAS